VLKNLPAHIAKRTMLVKLSDFRRHVPHDLGVASECLSNTSQQPYKQTLTVLHVSCYHYSSY